MAGLTRAFLFAPSREHHETDLHRIEAALPRLSDADLMDAAYRRSGSRQAAFAFAQGAVVGTLGNLLASAVGHFIDRAGAWTRGDTAWLSLGVTALGVVVLMTVGALRRHEQNLAVEARFLVELRRRGFEVESASDDPDELLGLGPTGPGGPSGPKQR
jgi:hypothetical protein